LRLLGSNALDDANRLFRGLSPRVSYRELALALAVSLAAAIVSHWSILLHMGSRIVGGGTDPLQQAWSVAWSGFAILHQPESFFDANAFWPLANSLAFSDSLAGYAPAGLIGDGAEAATLRYNLLHIVAYAAAAAAAHLLARELGASRWSASVAGAAFAFAPWRLAHSTHLNILSSAGIPLALFLLIRGWRRQSPKTVFIAWVVATWQLTLGFNLGIQLAYVLLVCAVATSIALGRRREAVRSVLFANGLGALAFVAVALVFAAPYLDVRHDHPEARRTVFDVATFSPPPWGFLAAPEENLVWGTATSPLRDSLRFPSEQTLFPGIAIVALAIMGFGNTTAPRRMRRTLAAVGAASALLSLGIHTSLGTASYALPYRLLYELAPGVDALRTPGRLNTITSLALALLAAFGADRVIAIVRSRRIRPHPAVIVGALFCAIVTEGAGTLRADSVPPVPRPQGLLLAEPQVHLPFDGRIDPLYMLWSTEGFPRIVNGGSGFDPALTAALRSRLASFPDRNTISRLQRLGVGTVVLHLDLAAGTRWEDAATANVADLAVKRIVRGRTLVFRIASQTKRRTIFAMRSTSSSINREWNGSASARRKHASAPGNDPWPR
jgi:hypothetical protein